LKSILVRENLNICGKKKLNKRDNNVGKKLEKENEMLRRV